MKESEKKEFLIKFSRSGGIAALKNVCHDLIDAEECGFLDSKGAPIEKTKRHIRLSKKSGFVKCSCGKMCLLLPVAQGDNTYGYALLSHLKQEPQEKIVELLKSFIDLALKEFQKEQELATLYDTIRPRAIALSTIHTIHRLLSSTLNMDELIERIARLTLQVMRSKHCSIMLLDDSKKYLMPKAIIDLENNTGNGFKKYRRIRVGNHVEGKVAKTGKAYLSRNLICVPLIEEDIIGVISARDKTSSAAFDKFEMEILATLAEQAVIAIKNAQMYEEQEKMAYGSIKSLAALLDTKSPNTYTHSDQFVRIVIAIAEE
ncbi:MAG: GAF domain-containing protein, partial [Candidatus Omnitrophota bacterium]